MIAKNVYELFEESEEIQPRNTWKWKTIGEAKVVIKTNN